MSVADSVAAALEGRSRLLVFDNCEHVLDAAADMIEAILARSDDGEDRWPPAARDCGWHDEQLWPVPSLDIDSGLDSPQHAVRRARRSAIAPDISLT